MVKIDIHRLDYEQETDKERSKTKIKKKIRKMKPRDNK
tara:strand:- start:235 stop:348 length:114 start_codon:yes stop_codon:yes gene_type:complete